MNKQIRELAVSAGYGNRWNTTEEFEAFLEKFAGLVVKECVDILMEPSYVMDKSQKLSQYNQGWVNGRLLGIEHIEQQFGVE